MARSLFDSFVVLMLENRSLDHLLRYLGIGDRIPRGEATNSLKPSDNSSETFFSRRGGDYTAIGDGPLQSFKQTNEQLFGKTEPPANVAASERPMSGFMSSLLVSLRCDLRAEPSERQQFTNCFDLAHPARIAELRRSARHRVRARNRGVHSQRLPSS